MIRTRKCFVISGDKGTPAKFYGVYQVAEVVGESPLIGGHSAGQIMEPVAVVEYDGQLHKAYLDQVRFDEVEVRDAESVTIDARAVVKELVLDAQSARRRGRIR